MFIVLLCFSRRLLAVRANTSVFGVYRNNNLWCVHTNETFYTERATLTSDSMDGFPQCYNTLINTNHSVIEDSLLSDIVSFC